MSTIQEFDYSLNLAQVLLWQYNEAVNLQSLVEAKQAWYDQNFQTFWESWFENVFDLQTADPFGLLIWCIILNLPYFIYQGDNDGATIFGFNAYISFPTLENTYENFNGIGTSPPSSQLGANFSDIGSDLILAEEAQRFILRLRYFQLANRGDIVDINNFLQFLGSTTPAPYGGSMWVLEDYGMRMTYVFNFPLPPILLRVLYEYDLLPRPAGVGLRYIDSTVPVWGFNQVVDFPTLENTYQNFNNGNFYSPIP